MPVTFNGFTVSVDPYKAAYNAAKSALSKAVASSSSIATSSNKTSQAYKDASAAYKRFFGANNPATVSARIKMVYSALLTSDMDIDFDATDSSKAYVFASHCATAPGLPFTAKIHFCPALVDGFSALGTNSSAGTIIHEATHLVLNTDDVVYGIKSCSELSDVDKLRNADNYKYYCELFQLARLSLMPALSDSYDGKHGPPR